VADLRIDEATPWLERELARQLAPVAAPDGLWGRIQEARRMPRRSVSFRWAIWPAFALLTLFVCAGALRKVNLAREQLNSRSGAVAIFTKPVNAGEKRSSFSAGNGRAACLMCHANTPGIIAMQ